MADAVRSRAALPTLFGVVIVDLVGFGIVMPVLPFFARSLEADALTLGLLFTSYAAMQFVFAPLWGRLSDRIGRRPVLLLTIAGTAGSLLLLGFAETLPVLFLARLLGGAFAANVSVATAYVADVVDPDERTTWMGRIGASFAVGFVLGPALGALLSPLGHHVPLLAAAGLAAANWVLAAAVLPEPERRESTASGPSSRFEALRLPGVARLCGIYLIFSVAVTQLEVVFAWFTQDRLGWEAWQFGTLLVGMAVLMGAVQGGAIKPLVARFGERSLVIGGCAVLAVAFLLLPFQAALGSLVAVLAVAAVGRGVAQPPLMGLASQSTDAGSQGVVMGTFQSSASLARVIGPLAAGLYDLSPIAPFHLAGGLLLVAAVLATSLPEGEGRGASTAAGSEA